MGQEISELNKPPVATDEPASLSGLTPLDFPSSQDYTSQGLSLGHRPPPTDEGGGDDRGDGDGGGDGNFHGGLVIPEQASFDMGYSSSMNHERSSELGGGGGAGPSVMPHSQEEQLQQILLRHQGQVQRPQRGGAQRQQQQQLLQQQQQQQQAAQAVHQLLLQLNQQSQQSTRRGVSTRPANDRGFNITSSRYSSIPSPNVGQATDIKINRLSEEEVTKIVETEGYKDINIYDTSVPAELKKVLAGLHSDGRGSGLGELEFKSTRLSPNAAEFVPGKPLGSSSTLTTTRQPQSVSTTASFTQAATSGYDRGQFQEQNFLQALYEYGLIK
ncbi:conserved hypothetical protein [Perkinsus marinus ATCC 50983]|uniref:Uncharacterized protein n=1 Tax=Perkinsus marinus (strain ATCC 50983 / TXsc) TaxID=423536 RepID=C5KYB0_PERM5|nr:conserved hypothetical protein [Perkinsus marinus ATCC 50983]EER10487.1 conserved hypothetical protein [Perkinsus marinus ATCC 50983]|eukprot:XP_002778692.1 conserved hypothetical protein [Perkinsus marinus ATCC 50983]